MQIIIRYVKDEGDSETVRQQTVSVATKATAHYIWHEAVAMAVFHAQPGERIVAIFKKGYE